MYCKTVLVLLGFLLLAQVHGDSNINAKVSGEVDVESNIAEVTADLKALFSASFTKGLNFSVGTFDLSFSFDTNGLEEGTVTFDTSELNDEGYFEATFAVNDLSMSVDLTVEDSTFNGSLGLTLAATAQVSATMNEDNMDLELHDLTVEVEDVSIDINGLSQTIINAGLSGTLRSNLNVALKAVADALIELGAELVVVVKTPVVQVFAEIPRVTVTIEGEVEEFNDDREAIVSAFVDVLAKIDAGNFENGIFIGDVSAGAEGEVMFDFWILDNEDDDSGEEASEKLASEYESDSEVFADSGIAVKSLKVNANADGDGSGAACVAPSLLF